MTDEELCKALRAIDHMSLEDCFLQSPYFTKAADRIELLATTNEQLVATNEALVKERDALRQARDDWRDDFKSLSAAIVGDTGLSAMTVALQARLYRPRADRAEAALAARQADLVQILKCDEQMIFGEDCEVREAFGEMRRIASDAIAQPHNVTALDRMLDDAREKALREAARCTINNQDCSPWEISDAILALIDKKEDTTNDQPE